MGASAGTSNTGSKNTFVGYLAGYDSATTSSSVFLGYAAGQRVKASGNIAIGENALACTGTGGTGNQNIAIGNASMQTLEGSAGFNVGVGGQTFKNLTTGNNNSALGYEAGENITTGSNNVILGYEAVTEVGANPSDIVAIGYQAGFQNNGSKNVFVGKNAGSSGSVNNNGQSTGQENVGIGYFSLYNLTTGNTNIAIGHTAGNLITTGSNNVVIGEANVPSATGDSQLSISNGDGTVTWIQGDSNGLVANKISVVAVTTATTLTDAQSGSYVYVTGSGAPTLPATAEVGQQYTIINNTGSDLTPGLGTSNSSIPSSHTAISDDAARTYVAVAANTWFFVG
jgi:hypothetical protein